LEVVVLSAIALHPKHMFAQPVELDADWLLGRFSFTSGSFFNKPGQVIIAAVQDVGYLYRCDLTFESWIAAEAALRGVLWHNAGGLFCNSRDWLAFTQLEEK
jgi:hypothetical protein